MFCSKYSSSDVPVNKGCLTTELDLNLKLNDVPGLNDTCCRAHEFREEYSLQIYIYIYIFFFPQRHN